MGRSTPNLNTRRAVYEAAGYACQQCGLQFPVRSGTGAPWITVYSERKRRDVIWILELDHIVPVLRGGHTTRANLQALCTPCNARKGAKV